MFEEITPESFDQRERRILKFWETHRIFEKSVNDRTERPIFSFYDGPPFATGLPHYGHLLAGTIKDVIPRYKTMKGFCVPRRFGWDCHGLPVEQEIEKAFNLSGAPAIEEFGIANYNEECRKIVLRYTEEWKITVSRMGRWVDFGKTYRTMDLDFMESVWWVFNQLYEKGLVYEGYKVMPFSAKLGTPLSNFEAGENYRDVDDPALTIAFNLVAEPTTSILAWTTTPWTLISNLALMVGPDIDYVKIKDVKLNHHYILAKSRLSAYYKEESDYEVVEEFKGASLNGVKYEPLLPYFADRKEKGAFRVILEPSVSIEDGTGIVHSAPAFGEVDFYACQREKIELVCPVNNNGLFTNEIFEYEGQFVKDADKEIIKRLKKQGSIFLQATIHHRYPFCPRSDTPLIYKAVKTWFVSVETLKAKLLKANDQIHWTPGHIKLGRFGKWLEGARDWAISRNRYWGTPIPLFRSDDGEIISVGSIDELQKLTGHNIKDLHRHFIDDLTCEKNGKIFKRIPEVFDCWFESGSMPYAQNHYPFENKDLFEDSFPADFIAEGLDQTRGWFYTLTILAAALFDKPAFKNVVVNGIVLAEDGNKMSKRLRNYPDPTHVIQKFGADAIRLYLMHSPAVRGDNLCFKESGVELVLRQVMIPMWNAYSFFISYARIYSWKPVNLEQKPESVMDRWMLSCLHKLIKQVEDGLNAYDLAQAVEPFIGFVEQLTNWYIRRSRRRFWSDKASADRDFAFSTLYQVLLALTKISAPFIPFMSEAIYQNLKETTSEESVHLCDFPAYNEHLRDTHLESVMDIVQTTVSLGHALRKEHKLKVRQPLGTAYIASSDATLLQFLDEQQHLVADELNVKKIVFVNDETKYVTIKAKPNFRVLGKKVHKWMKQAQIEIEGFSPEQLQALLDGQNVKIVLGGEEFELTPEDAEVERIVKAGMIAAHQNKITIVLDTALTEDLLLEGIAREIVNKVNTMRREDNLDLTARIVLHIETSDRVIKAYKQHEDFIKNEVLATDVVFASSEGTTFDLNGEPAKILIVF
jgi:isoleucyl-tRNA synthetase